MSVCVCVLALTYPFLFFFVASSPFMCLLGTGLVTSEGKTWRESRTSVSKVLRVDILDEIPVLAKKAVERLAGKLEESKRTNTPLEIAEEFRHLTLQV